MAILSFYAEKEKKKRKKKTSLVLLNFKMHHAKDKTNKVE